MAKKTTKREEPFAEFRTGKTALTLEEAKDLMGWTEEIVGEDGRKTDDFGDDYLLRIRRNTDKGKSTLVKVRCEKNKTNRPFSKSLAQDYGAEIREGKWHLNGQSIILDWYGNVLSGQHRLLGFILEEEARLANPKAYATEHGVRKALTLETLLVGGISDRKEVVDTIDIGKKRSLADVLYTNRQFGKTYSARDQKKLSTILSQSARLLWKRLYPKESKFRTSVALDTLKAHPQLQQCVEWMLELDVETEGGISSQMGLGMASALCYLFMTHETSREAWKETGEVEVSEITETKNSEFWTLLATGEGLKSGHPVHTLREKILKKLEASGHVGRQEVQGSTIKAWRYFLAGGEAQTKDLKLKRSRIKHETGETTVEISEFPRVGGLDVDPAETAIPEDDEVSEVEDQEGNSEAE